MVFAAVVCSCCRIPPPKSVRLRYNIVVREVLRVLKLHRDKKTIVSVNRTVNGRDTVQNGKILRGQRRDGNVAVGGRICKRAHFIGL